MWTRAELKTRAKSNLKKYFWAAFVVSLICAMLGSTGSFGGVSSSVDSESRAESPGQIQDFYQEPGGYRNGGNYLTSPYGGGYDAVTEEFDRIFTGVFFAVIVVMTVIMIALGIFIGPPIMVGKNRFYMESRSLGKSAGIGKVTWGFSNHYLKIVKTMFVKNLISVALPVVVIFVSTFLAVFFIIALEYTELSGVAVGVIMILFIAALFASVVWSIYFEYCYLMVPYILSENSDMKSMDVLKLSKRMMDGHKLNTWILGLSFIGWWILGFLACCIGMFFVQPYFDATFAELYAVLRQPYSDRLNGYGYPDVIPAGGAYGTYVDPVNTAPYSGTYLNGTPYNDGNRYGNGTAYENGNGYGNGTAYENGNGHGTGTAYENGNGHGTGTAYENGNGYGNGTAYENGNGYGNGTAYDGADGQGNGPAQPGQ